MSIDQSISTFLKPGRPFLSAEFFPPKDEAGGEQILRTAGELKAMLDLAFVSITYGAGGSTQDRTIRYASMLKDDLGFRVMPHLTCVGSSRERIRGIVGTFHANGFRNLMLLRGDPPKGAVDFQVATDGFAYASELVSFVKSEFPDFCIGVAGYPEKHPEAASAEVDLAHLKHKVDCGADFVTTQLFFDNARYFDFVARCRAIGIRVPIVPGLMPVTSLSSIRRICSMCRTDIPAALEASLVACGDDEAALRAAGLEWAYGQIRGLLDGGAPGIHLYLLNRSDSARILIDRLRRDGRRFV